MVGLFSCLVNETKKWRLKPVVDEEREREEEEKGWAGRLSSKDGKLARPTELQSVVRTFLERNYAPMSWQMIR